VLDVALSLFYGISKENDIFCKPASFGSKANLDVLVCGDGFYAGAAIGIER
jgi:hypothetical protein